MWLRVCYVGCPSSPQHSPHGGFEETAMPRNKRDNGAGSVYRDEKNDRWIGEVVLDGRRRRVSAPRNPDASAKLARLIGDHEAGTAALDGRATVATVGKLWSERVLPGRGLSP